MAIFLGIAVFALFHLYTISSYNVTLLKGGGNRISYYVYDYQVLKESRDGRTYIVLLLALKRPWTTYYFQYPKLSSLGDLYLVFDENNRLTKDSIYMGPSARGTKNLYILDGQANLEVNKLTKIDLASSSSDSSNISVHIKKIDLSEAKQAELSDRELWIKNTNVDYLY